MDTLGALIQSIAEVLDKATNGGDPSARRVKAAAGIGRSIAGFNRDVEVAVDRQLEVRSDMITARHRLDASMRVAMDHFYKQANTMLAQLEACEPARQFATFTDAWSGAAVRCGNPTAWGKCRFCRMHCYRSSRMTV